MIENDISSCQSGPLNWNAKLVVIRRQTNRIPTTFSRADSNTGKDSVDDSVNTYSRSRLRFYSIDVDEILSNSQPVN